MGSAFWEDQARVEEFAAREPDSRLRARLDAEPRASDLRCLDLGCAGGRNAELLAARGVDVYAIDASKAMVTKTRARLAAHVPPRELDARVRRCRMDALDWAPDEFFSLVVAFGILHHAASSGEWDRTLKGLVRVLKPDGELLVSIFAPQTRLGPERPPEPVPGVRHLFDSVTLGRCHLLDSAALDRELGSRGFVAVVPTATIRREVDSGLRVTTNGHHRRPRSGKMTE